jgi:hypothetical protein
LTSERFCRRCSVVRVNLLCGLYEQGFKENDDVARARLKTLVDLAGKRGYRDGASVMYPDLQEEFVRRVCWNISSLLSDDDFSSCGVSVNGGRKGRKI